MTAKEAYKEVMKKASTMRVTDCYEYDSIFVFQLAPAIAKESAKLLTGLTSVNKKTGTVSAFKPFMIPFSEYQRGKRVPASVYGG